MTSVDTERTITVSVNGVPREATVPVRRLLSDALRHDLELTGTHVGCEHGVCGACTVLVDGAAVRSCLMLAVQVDGAEVTTIEGLEHDGQLHPLQQAFRESFSFQCGFCTPGFVMTALALFDGDDRLDELPDAELREHLSGNLCRCTGYQSIVDGVRLAAARMAAGAPEAGGAA